MSVTMAGYPHSRHRGVHTSRSRIKHGDTCPEPAQWNAAVNKSEHDDRWTQSDTLDALHRWASVKYVQRPRPGRRRIGLDIKADPARQLGSVQRASSATYQDTTCSTCAARPRGTRTSSRSEQKRGRKFDSGVDGERELIDHVRVAARTQWQTEAGSAPGPLGPQTGDALAGL